MKKLAVVLAVCLMVLGVAAQNKDAEALKKHEVSASVGLIGDNQLLALVGDVLGTVLTVGYVAEIGNYDVLTPSVNYQYAFNKRISLGGTFIFDHNSLDVSVKKLHSDDRNIVGSYDRYYYTFAVEGVFNYLSKTNHRLYGFLGAGLTIANIPSSKLDVKSVVYPNFQFTPIGYKFGNKFGGFFEIGYGYKGFINAGLFTRF